MAKFGGFVSPLKGVDAQRDRERDGAKNFSLDAATYAENIRLGDLMSEMLNSLVVAKPDKPVDHLIELLGKKTAPRVCVVAPPGFVVAGVTQAICEQNNTVLVSFEPLLEEARERIIDGKTVADHEAEGKGIPDHIVIKLITERLVKPDCVEKGWLLEGVPATKGQAQQLVAAGHVPDKVVYVSATDDILIKAVADGEDVNERKKELVGKLASYRWELQKSTPTFAHVSRLFEVTSAYMPADQLQQIHDFIAEKPADAGLKDIKRG